MKHWIFDFDGTLVNSEGYFSRSLSYALEPFDLTLGSDFIEKIRHRHPDEIFDDYLEKNDAKQALNRMAEMAKEIATEIQLFPHVREIVETIADHGESLSIWTGRDLGSTTEILRQLDFLKPFSKIISGTCVKINKPGHDGLLEIQKAYSANTDEMVMIGDHHHDIEPANHLGLVSVHAQWKSNPHQLPQKVKPNYQFGSTLDFHNWIKEVFNS